MSVTFTGFPEEGLRFLRALKRNNNREWFQAHKSDYEEFIKKPMEGLVLSLGSDLSKIAPEIVATPKASLFRIYRDTRFSKDKSPYKTHVAASFPHRGLDKHQGAGLYLHIAPTEVFLGGGIYMPASEDLSAVRHHIAGNISQLQTNPRRKGISEDVWGLAWRSTPQSAEGVRVRSPCGRLPEIQAIHCEQDARTSRRDERSLLQDASRNIPHDDALCAFPE